MARPVGGGALTGQRAGLAGLVTLAIGADLVRPEGDGRVVQTGFLLGPFSSVYCSTVRWVSDRSKPRCRNTAHPRPHRRRLTRSGRRMAVIVWAMSRHACLACASARQPVTRTGSASCMASRYGRAPGEGVIPEADRVVTVRPMGLLGSFSRLTFGKMEPRAVFRKQNRRSGHAQRSGHGYLPRS